MVELDYHFKNLTTEEVYFYKLQQCVKKFIKNNGYVKYSVDTKVFTDDGGSFLSMLYQAQIKGETENGRKLHNLLLKIITPGDQMTILSITDAYKRELFVYYELAKVFQKLQHEVKVPIEERYKMVKCYEESTADVIVLDNMVPKGYTTIFRMDVLSLHYAALAVKELAKFHALSFVLENKRPIFYDRKIKTVSQPLTINEDMEVLINKTCQVVLNNLEGENWRRFKAYAPNMAKKYKKILGIASARNVLCHGDYRPNNLLSKEVNGEVTELIPIDYQLIYYGCPVMDLIYLIYPATDREFRKAHLTHIKEIYYNELRRFLKYFGLDVAKVYPKEEFEANFKDRQEYGLVVSLILLPFLLANEDEMPEITGDLAIDFKVDRTFKSRVTGLIEDFIENGCL